jgi:superfamily II DNA or RNA helicase
MKPDEVKVGEGRVIIVASSGCFSTGINIKNIHSIIFAAPTKSQIRVLQSIGRGLRKSDDGRPTTVYDISDNFSWKKKKNYTLQHAIERTKMYAKEGFNYKLYEIQLP